MMYELNLMLIILLLILIEMLIAYCLVDLKLINACVTKHHVHNSNLLFQIFNVCTVKYVLIYFCLYIYAVNKYFVKNLIC